MANRKRQNRSAAGRRQQYDRAHARVVQTLIKGFTALDHRGCRRTKLGDSLFLLLSAHADHGADHSMLYADSHMPEEWQWWPQPEAPWPQWPQWPPPQQQQEPESLAEPFQANPSTSVSAAWSPLGPADEDLESNWSFSCTSVAPDGRFPHGARTPRHEERNCRGHCNRGSPSTASSKFLEEVGARRSSWQRVWRQRRGRRHRRRTRHLGRSATGEPL